MAFENIANGLMTDLVTQVAERTHNPAITPTSALTSHLLRVPGAPLDNNVAERTLKMAILHRKNSMGYKTVLGAKVGDLFMSLIHTCQRNGANPFAYLLALARNPEAVAAQPSAWLPWNYPHPATA